MTTKKNTPATIPVTTSSQKEYEKYLDYSVTLDRTIEEQGVDLPRSERFFVQINYPADGYRQALDKYHEEAKEEANFCAIISRRVTTVLAMWDNGKKLRSIRLTNYEV